MSSPTFSIIIVARSISDYLRNEGLPAIDSQSFDSFEVLLVIDEGNSGKKELMRQYPWLRFFNLKNKPGDKRDFAAQKAKGEYLAFLDDDAAPHQDWLRAGYEVFEERADVTAIGGPGILPQSANIWERLIDEVLKSWLGSGGYAYRFIPSKEREIDDYPSMNLMIRKDIFLNVDGFQNMYWPGEDSKLLNTLVHDNGKKIIYHPEVLVYHHRRNSLKGHIDQYKKYGETRGTFFAQGDSNSKQLPYIMPTLFTIYIVGVVLSALLFLLNWIPEAAFLLIVSPLIVYAVMLLTVTVETLLNTKNVILAIGVLFFLPVTHLTYGLFFLKGMLQESLIHALHLKQNIKTHNS